MKTRFVQTAGALILAGGIALSGGCASEAAIEKALRDAVILDRVALGCTEPTKYADAAVAEYREMRNTELDVLVWNNSKDQAKLSTIARNRAGKQPVAQTKQEIPNSLNEKVDD